MRKRWMARLAVALAIVVIPATALPQAQSDTTRVPHTMKGKGGKWGERKERMRAAFLKRLGEELVLDESTMDKVAQSFDHLRDQTQGLRQGRKTVKTKLQEAVNSGASDAEIEAIFTEAQVIRDKYRQIRTAHQAELQQILGSRGFAKYVLFKQQFRREIRKKMHERRGSRRGSESYQPKAFNHS